MRINKKRLERFYLTQFIDIYDKAIEIITDGENPDFLCKRRNEVFGIELTSLKMKSLSEITGLQRKIVQKAQELAEGDLEPMEIKVWFSEYNTRYGAYKINQAALYIYETVKQTLSKIANNDGHSNEIETGGNRFGIIFLTANLGIINGKRWLANHRWQTQEPGFVNMSFESDLQEIINQKNKKYNKYLEKIDSCWLLVTIDRRKKEEKFDYARMKKQRIYNSLFDKTILFDVMERKAYNLNTVK